MSYTRQQLTIMAAIHHELAIVELTDYVGGCRLVNDEFSGLLINDVRDQEAYLQEQQEWRQLLHNILMEVR